MTSKLSSILVVMPSYFDLATASIIIREIRELRSKGLEVACLVVDESKRQDGSWDANENGLIVELESRVGAQMAVVSVIRAKQELLRQFDLICVMDSDGEDAPRDLWRLVNSLHDGVEMALAERGRRHSQKRFKIGYQCFRVLHRIATGRSLRTGSFVVVRTSWLLENINKDEFNFSFNGALVALENQSVRVVCDRQRRRQGRSKMSFENSLSDGIRILLSQVRDIKRRLFWFLRITLSTFGSITAVVLLGQLVLHTSSRMLTLFVLPVSLVIVFCASALYLALQIVDINGGDLRSRTPIISHQFFSGSFDVSSGSPPKKWQEET